MNVLIVTQYFWPELFRVNDLAIGLKERGHNVTVLTGTPNYPNGRFFPGYGIWKKQTEDFQGIRVIRVPQIPRGKGRNINLALNYLSYALVASVLGPVRCRGRIDVICAFQMSPATIGIPTLVLKRMKGAPVLFWVQDLWPESLSATGAVRSRWLLKPVEIMLRIIYRGSDRILMQSRAFSEAIARLGGERERLRYLPNTAETLYKPVPASEAMARRIGAPNGFRVMFAGNIGAAQDFPSILAAAEILRDYPDIHFLIVGDGRMRSWVDDQIRRRNLTANVHMLGAFPVDEMPQLFALADALLVTLKRDPIFSLTIPSKLQSYLACAKPVIAGLDGEGARILEESGAGLAAPSEDPGALGNAVLKLYRMPREQRDLMGSRGRKYFEEQFDRDMLLDRLNGWAHEVAQERGA